MNGNSPATSRYLLPSLLFGAAALGLLCIGLRTDREQFFQSYLWAWLFWLGVALGSMVLVMLRHLTGGEWGRIVQRPAEAAALTLPLLAIGFIPVMLGMHWLFPWTHAELVAADEVLSHKIRYLNATAFELRALVYFALWFVLAFFLRANSVRYDRSGDESTAAHMRTLSAAGLLIYIISITLASVDWIMSREPHWYSTILGLSIGVGQTASAMVFALILLFWLARLEPLKSYLQPSHLNDLGNLLLTLVILWAYLSFAQWLITWMGNIRGEIDWYTRRGLAARGSGWKWIGLGLVVVHFFIPFLILLSRAAKRRLAVLAWLSAVLLLMRLIDNFWLVGPSTMHTPSDDAPLNALWISWMDLAAPIGIGGLWMAAFLWLLGRQPLLARAQRESEILPRFGGVTQHGGAGGPGTS